jgi:enoyl-CoA hydratase
MPEFVKTVLEDHVAVVTLDRPPVNALSGQLLVELSDTFRDLDRDTEVRAVVVSGAGHVFSAGVDIRELRAAPPEDAVPRNARYQAIFLQVDCARVPVIAAVEGYALGGGLELALACDYRVAADDCFVGLPEINLGGLPGIGGMQRIQRQIGHGQAKRIVLTGERVEADEAHRIGLIEELVSAGEVKSRAVALARRIASRAPLSVQAGKLALDRGRGLPLQQSQEIDLRYCGEIAGTEDRIESLQAFLEKREPRIVGR